MPETNNFSSEYLYDLLSRIKQRPGMYLGKCSITRLNMLLTGYSLARIELGLTETKEEEEFGNFQDWIETKYQSTSNQGWDSLILLNSQDEKEAFHNFFQLFEQFRQEKEQKDSPVLQINY